MAPESLDLDRRKQAIPCSRFKLIEREISANRTAAICQRFGVTHQQYFDRKSAAYERLPLLIRVRQAVLAAPTTREIPPGNR